MLNRYWTIICVDDLSKCGWYCIICSPSSWENCSRRVYKKWYVNNYSILNYLNPKYSSSNMHCVFLDVSREIEGLESLYEQLSGWIRSLREEQRDSQRDGMWDFSVIVGFLLQNNSIYFYLSGNDYTCFIFT